MRQRFLQIGKAIISCSLLFWLFYSVSWDSMLSALVYARPVWFLFAIIAAVGQLTLSAWRWQLLLRLLGGENISLVKLVYYYFVSSFFNNFAPANIAGDATRISALFRQGQSGAIATGSVILERILNLFSLFCLCIWVLITQPFPIALDIDIWLVPSIGAGILMVGILSIWLWRRPPARLATWIAQLRACVQAMISQPYQFGQVLIITMALHVATMFITFGSLQAVSVQFPLHIHLAVYAIAGLAIALPISIQGLGLREGIYVGLLRTIGIPTEYVLTAMALNYIILILFSTFGGILFWAHHSSTTPRTL
jgi:glycosyltransferase 2 family protein